MWAAIIGVHVTAQQVALMMVALKVARAAGNQQLQDNYIDMAGYAALAGAIAGPVANDVDYLEIPPRPGQTPDDLETVAVARMWDTVKRGYTEKAKADAEDEQFRCALAAWDDTGSIEHAKAAFRGATRHTGGVK